MKKQRSVYLFFCLSVFVYLFVCLCLRSVCLSVGLSVPKFRSDSYLTPIRMDFGGILDWFGDHFGDILEEKSNKNQLGEQFGLKKAAEENRGALGNRFGRLLGLILEGFGGFPGEIFEWFWHRLKIYFRQCNFIAIEIQFWWILRPLGKAKMSFSPVRGCKNQGFALMNI